MLYTATVATNTLELLKELMQKPYLFNFLLVGGTSLSLQIGHRISDDLDMFNSTDFDTLELRSNLENSFESFEVMLETKNSLITNIENIKVDFIKFKYGFEYESLIEDGIRLANIKDIASMKLDALTGRGKKKDFYDLYFLLQHFKLTQLLELYQEKFKHTTIFHVIRSINYFEEAEIEPDPIVLDKTVTWMKVKNALKKEIQNLN